MSYDLLAPLALFAFVSSITPGPNNLMLMASGANFGFRRTVAHMLGIGIGFTVMILLVGLGLIQIFDAYPVTHQALKLVSTAYLLWLAWRIATAAGVHESDASPAGHPMSFLQAALFQWVNPKAWSMALSAIALYAPDRSLWAVLAVALIFGTINLPCVSLWTVLGQQMRRVLTNHKRLRAFNWTMSGLLVLSLYPVLVVYSV